MTGDLTKKPGTGSVIINCVYELINRPAVFRLVFGAHDELEALVGCVAKFRTLRVQRIQPELLTRPGREMPA